MTDLPLQMGQHHAPNHIPVPSDLYFNEFDIPVDFVPGQDRQIAAMATEAYQLLDIQPEELERPP